MIPYNKIAIIIPSFNPDIKLLQLLDNLHNGKFENIICVDDGSKDESKKILKDAANNYQCTLLTHCVNLGKGRALKTAFNYIANELPECQGAITVDADGQHRIEDIILCAKALASNDHCLVMGCRNFTEENIPFRSRFGNILTSKMVKLLCGIKLSDTQTGLRGIAKENIKKFMNISGERFEFEMNMILFAKENNIELLEVPIQTVYLANNESSHFNPIVDSIKIYALFLKFLIASLSSSVVDILAFSFLVMILKDRFESIEYIVAATVIARVISAVFNFTINKKSVFRTSEKMNIVAFKYSILCVVQMFLSATVVSIVYNITNVNESIIKIVVDSLLFLVSFQIQREWVFKKMYR